MASRSAFTPVALDSDLKADAARQLDDHIGGLGSSAPPMPEPEYQGVIRGVPVDAPPDQISQPGPMGAPPTQGLDALGPPPPGVPSAFSTAPSGSLLDAPPTPVSAGESAAGLDVPSTVPSGADALSSPAVGVLDEFLGGLNARASHLFGGETPPSEPVLGPPAPLSGAGLQEHFAGMTDRSTERAGALGADMFGGQGLGPLVQGTIGRVGSPEASTPLDNVPVVGGLGRLGKALWQTEDAGVQAATDKMQQTGGDALMAGQASHQAQVAPFEAALEENVRRDGPLGGTGASLAKGVARTVTDPAMLATNIAFPELAAAQAAGGLIAGGLAAVLGKNPQEAEQWADFGQGLGMVLSPAVHAVRDYIQVQGRTVTISGPHPETGEPVNKRMTFDTPEQRDAFMKEFDAAWERRQAANRDANAPPEPERPIAGTLAEEAGPSGGVADIGRGLVDLRAPMHNLAEEKRIAGGADPFNYAAQKAALTRAVKTGDYEQIKAAASAAVAEWNKPGAYWPDDWRRWQRALDDAAGPDVRAPDIETLVAPAPPATRPRTPQIPALPGSTPLGISPQTATPAAVPDSSGTQGEAPAAGPAPVGTTPPPGPKAPPGLTEEFQQIMRAPTLAEAAAVWQQLSPAQSGALAPALQARQEQLRAEGQELSPAPTEADDAVEYEGSDAYNRYTDEIAKAQTAEHLDAIDKALDGELTQSDLDAEEISDLQDVVAKRTSELTGASPAFEAERDQLDAPPATSEVQSSGDAPRPTGPVKYIVVPEDAKGYEGPAATSMDSLADAIAVSKDMVGEGYHRVHVWETPDGHSYGGGLAEDWISVDPVHIEEQQGVTGTGPSGTGEADRDVLARGEPAAGGGLRQEGDAQVPREQGSGVNEEVRRGTDDDRGDASGGGVAAGTAGDSVRELRPDVANHLAVPQVSHSEPNVVGHDYRITVADNLDAGGGATKAEQNMAAIELVHRIDAENRRATPEEQAILVKYSGWGSHEYGPMFKTDYNLPQTEQNAWAARANRLKELVGQDEYESIQRSRLNAHFTTPEVITAMWNALDHLGFARLNRPRWLETSAGNGRFLGLQPADTASRSQRTAVELDKVTGAILKQLYQTSDVYNRGLQETPLPDNYYDLVMSNVPFGKYRVTDRNYLAARDRFKGATIHNYFFFKALDKVRPGGVIAFVTSNGTMDARTSAKVRRALADKADLLAAVRLPNTAFKGSAGTSVVTDVIFLRKRMPGEVSNAPEWIKSREINDPDGQPLVGPNEDDPDGRSGNDKLYVNEYFHDHPDMVLGDHAATGSMYRKGTYSVEPRPGLDVAKELEHRLRKMLPKDVFQEATRGGQAEIRLLPPEVDNQLKEGAYVLEKGKLLQRKANELVPVKADKDTTDRIKGMLAIRDTARNVLDIQNVGVTDKALKAAQATLNKTYDKYVEHFGKLNDNTVKLFNIKDKKSGLIVPTPRSQKGKNVVAIGIDPDAEFLRGLEVRKGGQWTKSDLFSQRVTKAAVPATSASSPKDALMVTLNQVGRVDIDQIAQMVGMSPEKTQQDLRDLGLVYENPEGGWETADEYLSGKVRDKLAAARVAASVHPDRYDANITALEAVQPKPLPASEITVRLGAPWVPRKYVNEFVDDVLGDGYGGGRGFDNGAFTFLPSTGTWVLLSEPQVNWQKNTLRYGVGFDSGRGSSGRVSGVQLIELALNGKVPTIRKPDLTDPEGKRRLVDNPKTELARARQRQLMDEFVKWAWRDPERSSDLVDIYNEKHNDTVDRQFDGSHLTFTGMASTVKGQPFELRPHQKNGVWRIVQNGTAGLFWSMGFGKTAAQQAAGMEMRRLGLSRKNLYILPDENLLRQFAAEFRQLYPGANLLIAEPTDFEGPNRRTLFARIATGDWDGVLITQPQFTKIPVRPETELAHHHAAVEELREAIRAMEQARIDRGERVKPTPQKRLETRLANRQAKVQEIQAKLAARRDVTNLTFEDLGIDMMFADEAHAYKNLEFYTAMDRIRGLPNTYSGRSSDMLMKSSYLLRRNGGRGLVFSTGTPVSNTIAELWTMMRYLMPDRLEELGMNNFDAWARTFGDTVTTMGQSVSGAYKQLTRFAKFTNAPELSTLFKSVADVLMPSDLKMPVPRMIGADGLDNGGKPITIVVPPTAGQTAYMLNDILPRLELLSGPVATRPDPSEDNHLKLTGDARKAAIDMSLVDPSTPDDPASKINRGLETVADIWKETKADKGTQLIAIDSGVPKVREGKDEEDAVDSNPAVSEDDVSGEDDGALTAAEQAAETSLYEKIRTKLVKLGIPREQIAFIHEAVKPEDKAQQMQDVRDGTVRILIGSRPKMGMGVNVQERLAAIHHFDAPWRPDQLEQMDGRILRPGNIVYGPTVAQDGMTVLHPGKGVRIFRWLTERPAFDGYIWQMLLDKARAKEQIVRRNVTAREVVDTDDVLIENYELATALASGDPDAMRMVELKGDIARLEMLEAAHRDEMASFGFRIKNLPSWIENNKQAAVLWTEFADEIAKAPSEVGIGAATYKDPKDAAAALEDWFAANAPKSIREIDQMDGHAHPIGSFHGFPLSVKFDVRKLGSGAREAFANFKIHSGAGSDVYAWTTDIDPLEPKGKGSGWLTRIDNALDQPAKKADVHAKDAEREKETLARLKEEAARPFEQSADLNKLRRELARIEARMEGKEAPAEDSDLVEAVRADDLAAGEEMDSVDMPDVIPPMDTSITAPMLDEPSPVADVMDEDVVAPAEEAPVGQDNSAMLAEIAAAQSVADLEVYRRDIQDVILGTPELDRPDVRAAYDDVLAAIWDRIADLESKESPPESAVAEPAPSDAPGGSAPGPAAEAPPATSEPAAPFDWLSPEHISVAPEAEPAAAASPSADTSGILPSHRRDPVRTPAPAADPDALAPLLPEPPEQPPRGKLPLATPSPQPETQLSLDDAIKAVEKADSVDALRDVLDLYSDSQDLTVDVDPGESEAFFDAYDKRLNELRATAPATPEPVPSPALAPATPTPVPSAAASSGGGGRASGRGGRGGGAGRGGRRGAGAAPGGAGGVPPPATPPPPTPTPYDAAADMRALMESFKDPETGLGEKADAAYQQMMADWYDRLYPLKRISDQSGIPAYYAARLVPGMRGAGEAVVERHFVPILRQIGERLMNEFTGYAVAKHDADLVANHAALVAAGAQIDPLKLANNVKDPMAAWAEKERSLSPTDAALIKRVHQEFVAAWNTHVLDYMASGDHPLIDEERRDVLRDKYPNYLTMRRQGYDLVKGLSRGMGAAREASVPESIFKAVQPDGSDRKVKNPILEMLMHVPQVYAQKQRNEASVLLGQALKAQDTENAREAQAAGLPIPPKLIKVGHYRLDKTTGNMVPSFHAVEDNEFGVIHWYDATKTDPDKIGHYFAQVPRTMAVAANSLDAEVMGLAVQFFGAGAQFFRYTATTINPAFAAFNIPRDLESSWFRGGVSPYNVKDWKFIVRGLVGAVTHNQNWYDAAQAGQFMSGFSDQAPATRTDFERMLAKHRVMGAIPVRNLLDVALLMPRLTKHFGQVTEEMTRIANYLAKVAPHLNDRDAPIWKVQGREYTIDFNKSGNHARIVNYMIPFFNAGLHGSANVARTFRGEHTSRTMQKGTGSPNVLEFRLKRGHDDRYEYKPPGHPGMGAFAKLLLPVTLSALAFLWNRQWDDELRQEIPEWVHRYSWPLIFGEIGERDPKTGIKKRIPLFIPVFKGPVAGFATAFPEQMIRYAWDRGDRTLLDRMLMATNQASQTLSPIEPGPGGVLPPGLKQAVELWANKDFFRDSPIESEKMLQRIPEDRYDESTSRAAILTSHGLSAIMRLAVDTGVSPKAMDHMLFKATGGLETYTAMAELPLSLLLPDKNPPGRAFEPEEDPIQGIARGPFVRRFIGARAGGSNEQGYAALDRVVAQIRMEASQDPELRRLDVNIGQVGDSVQVPKTSLSIPISPMERAEYQRVSWTYQREMLDKLYDLPLYTQADAMKQRTLIQTTTKLSHEKASAELLRDIGYDEVRERLMARKAG